MKKTYYNSPVVPIAVFIAGSLWEFIFLIIQGTFLANRFSYLEGVVGIGIFCFIVWSGFIIRVDQRTLTRRLFFFFSKTHNFADVESIREASDRDMYGTIRFTQIRFKNGDKWNLVMLSKKDIREIIETIHGFDTGYAQGAGSNGRDR